MTATTIKPCPFCGSTTTSIDEVDIRTYAVTCCGCGCIGPHDSNTTTGQSTERAVEIWNKRWGEGLPAGVCEALNSGDGVYRP